MVFEDKNVRRVWHNDEWYFSVVDVVEVLTDSIDSNAYWRKLKQRLKEEGNETVTNCHALKLLAKDEKLRETDCANTKEQIESKIGKYLTSKENYLHLKKKKEIEN